MTLYELAQRFVGEVREQGGAQHDPFIQWCHASCGLSGDTPDEVPWCSSFLNRLAWLLRLPRSKSARARSWLAVGTPIPISSSQVGDVVVLQRGTGQQPGADVLDAPGHVGLVAGLTLDQIYVLGGNQSDGVTVAPFPKTRVLGIRRLTGAAG